MGLIQCTILFNKIGESRNTLHTAVVAEWLRRLTRNQFPSGSVGSNPTDCENFFVCVNYDIWKMLSATVSNSTFAIQHRWFSGRMLACHAGGPGSIPGRCIFFFSKMFCPPYLNRIDVVKFSNFKVPHDSLKNFQSTVPSYLSTV